MRSTKKTVSLFQSHVFKHEFFLFRCCPFPVPSEVSFLSKNVDFFLIQPNIYSTRLNYKRREQGTGNREQGTGNREQGTDKKQKLLSLKLSQKKDVF
ncbi:hypothetical protein MEO93_29285, partial [Dolichospermum sp. ST_sed3]|nr:hypothetical protein [Dolichospermum sp. ST_sed3]